MINALSIILLVSTGICIYFLAKYFNDKEQHQNNSV